MPLPLLPVEQAWITMLDAAPSAGGVMDAERVYIPIQPEEIQALSRATGAPLWRQDVESVWPPVLVDGVLYIAASDEIHALDSATGDRKWRTSFELPMIAPIASAGNLVIGVLEKGAVVAFAAEDGRMMWTRDLGAPAHFTPVSDGTRVFFALDDSRVIALSLADGSQAWEQKLEGKLYQPSVDRDRVFVGSDNNYLYALDNKHGRLAWKWRTGGDVLGISTDEKGGAYYASLDNVLRSVNRGNGNQRWIKEVPTRPLLPPMTFTDGPEYEDIVILTGVTSEIDEFGAKKGVAAGMYQPPSDILGPPLIDPVLKPYSVAMVVITRDGRAIGLRPSAMMLPEPMITPLTELPGIHLDRDRITSAAETPPAKNTKKK